jgi:glycosyltransferase involved in cell wall biosynthesis
MKPNSASRDRQVNAVMQRPRVAVVSPFLDKRHGTERMVVEWISRLDSEFAFHVYSQHVEDLDLSRIVFHRVPRLPGPHLLNYLWWFGANHLWRAWHRRFRGLTYDVVFGPGVNCLDADVVSVHIVFAEILGRLSKELRLANNPVRSWPVLMHRKLYYKLIATLERRVFTDPRTQLILTSPRTAAELQQYYSRTEEFPVLYAGLDHCAFNPARRAEIRHQARRSLNLEADGFALLLIGNDCRKKGLGVLLDALQLLRDVPIVLLVVTNESAAAVRGAFGNRAADSRVRFLPLRADVEFYYAAADVYTGPSLEDTFALPATEAMACGLPVIMSSRAGASAFMTNGIDGFILDDPADANSLAAIIRKLYENPELCGRVGLKAAETARQFTWEQNASDLAAIFEQIIHRKSQPQPQTLTQEL